MAPFIRAIAKEFAVELKSVQNFWRRVLYQYNQTKTIYDKPPLDKTMDWLRTGMATKEIHVTEEFNAAILSTTKPPIATDPPPLSSSVQPWLSMERVVQRRYQQQQQQQPSLPKSVLGENTVDTSTGSTYDWTTTTIHYPAVHKAVYANGKWTWDW